MMDLQRVNAYMSKVEESEKKVLPHEGNASRPVWIWELPILYL